MIKKQIIIYSFVMDALEIMNAENGTNSNK